MDAVDESVVEGNYLFTAHGDAKICYKRADQRSYFI